MEFDRTDVPDSLQVDVSSPLPELNSTGGLAFKARDTSRGKRPIYAVVQRDDVPVRADVFRKLSRVPAANLVNPLALAVLPIALDGAGPRERIVTFFDLPASQPLLQSGQQATSIPFPTIRQSILPACVRALSALHGRGILHRCIRPEAVFMSGTGSQDFFLGECVSTPPGACSSAAFEPLERAVASNLGRGEGDESCDIFALGVTILSLFFGQTLGRHMNREQLLEARINQGSFWALSRGRDLPGAMNILMRGMLNDDPEDRWSLQDLANWLDGAVPSRRAGMRSWALARPVKFNGKMYTDRRLLAHVFAKDERQAAEFLRKTDFSNWIQQIISTEVFTDKLDRLLDVRPEMDLSASGSSDSKLVARVCAFLDPRGPVRYRGLSFMLDGIGVALAHDFAKRNEKALIAWEDMLRGGLLSTLVEIMMEKHKAYKAVYANLIPTVELTKNMDVGGGLEYALYILCDGAPCHSPLFEGKTVTSLNAVIVTLDEVTKPTANPTSLLDRHVMAFISARGKTFEGIFKRMAASYQDPADLMPTIMELFSVLQIQAGQPALNNLAKVLLSSYKPVTKKIRSKSTRKKVEEHLKKLENLGHLSKILQQVNMSKVLVEDEARFNKARDQALALRKEYARMARTVSPREAQIRRAGYRFAANAGYGALALALTFAILSLL